MKLFIAKLRLTGLLALFAFILLLILNYSQLAQAAIFISVVCFAIIFSLQAYHLLTKYYLRYYSEKEN